MHARARRSRLAGQVGEEWKLEVAAPPVEGKANRAVVEFFARSLGVPRSAVRIVAGERSPHKLIEIDGVTEQQFAGLMNHKDTKGTKEHKETAL